MKINKKMAFVRYSMDIIRESNKKIINEHDIGDILKKASTIYSIDIQKSENEIKKYIEILIKFGVIDQFEKKTYINLSHKGITPENICKYFHEEAIVDMKTVLGSLGIMHNPSSTTTITIPKKQKNWTIKKIETNFSTWEIYELPEEIFYVGTEEERSIKEGSYKKATPERAFCNMLYVFDIKMIPLDMDMKEMNMEIIKKLTKEMNMEQKLKSWMENKKNYDENKECDEKVSEKLGF